MSSIYLHHSEGFFIGDSRESFSRAAIKIISYGGANLVPIAVPRIYRSLNSKQLL